MSPADLGSRWHPISLELASGKYLHGIAEPVTPWCLNVAQHTEDYVLAVVLSPVFLDSPKGIEVALTRVGVMGRHGTTRDYSRDPEDRLPNADLAADPSVFLVGEPPVSSMSIRKRRASTSPTPRAAPSAPSDPSVMRLAGWPLRVPPMRSQRTIRTARPICVESASAHGPTTM